MTQLRSRINRVDSSNVPCWIVCSLMAFSAAKGEELPGHLPAFLDRHCTECHDDVSAEGDLNLLDLEFDPEDTGNFARWARVFDRVQSGEMPPKKKPRPEKDELTGFLSDLKIPLVEADRKRIAEFGRARVRRLNRAEYETVLSDLFEMPLHIREELPEDARNHGFPTVAEALNVSSVQVEAYLNVLDSIFDRVTTLYEKPKRRTHRLTYREENGIMQVYRKGGPFHVREDGVAFFGTEKFSHLNACMSQWTAPHTGKYRVKVSAYALRSGEEPVILSLRAGGVGHAESNHVPHVFLKHMPVVEGEPQMFEWEGWLERGHYFHVYPISLRPMRFEGAKQYGLQGEFKEPAAVVQWVEVDGPIFEEWPPASHRALWGDLPTEEIPGAKENPDPIQHLDSPPNKIAKPRMTQMKTPDQESGNKWEYSPDQKWGGEPIHRTAPIPKPLQSTHRLVSENPKKDAARLLRSFAESAFRHSPGDDELAPILALTNRWLDEGRDFESAMRVGYKALLTSPGFLYRQGTLPDGELTLDGPELAARLSFFLWNGGPDKQLRSLGESGEILNPAILEKEVERLLDDEKFERFLTEFLDSWLDLRLIDFTVPDEKLYPEFDPLVQWSMVEETRAFVREMIRKDLPVQTLIDSEFAMVNWRLAKLYDLPPVEGMEVQRVNLPKDSPRGGLMTQGSVLKVTANGTTTSPVVRGVWLMERIMGVTPDPPPPGIPAIEPDIRGATTVRELLEKHRSAESCASCHVKIDPPGVALENFDVIGGWRDNYRALKEELADAKPKYSALNKMPVFYTEGPPVDSSYEFPGGDSFDGVEGFKKLLLEDPRQIARGLVEKLVIYSTSAEVSFSDRDEIEKILDHAEPSEFGFRTLIREVVASELFRKK